VGYEENLEARGVLAPEKGENRFVVASLRVEGMIRWTRLRLENLIATGFEFISIGFQGLGKSGWQIDQQQTIPLSLYRSGDDARVSRYRPTLGQVSGPRLWPNARLETCAAPFFHLCEGGIRSGEEVAHPRPGGVDALERMAAAGFHGESNRAVGVYGFPPLAGR